MNPVLFFLGTCMSIVGVSFFAYRAGYKQGGLLGVKLGMEAYEKQLRAELIRVGGAVPTEQVKPEVWN